MSILTTENIGLSFGAFDLFKGISVTIANDSKIGLLGANGVGKTSLLLIMAGINQPTSGKVHLAHGRRLGYLRQEAMDAFSDRDHTVYTEMLTVFEPVLAMQDRLSEMEARMAAGDCSDSLLAEYGKLQEAFDRAGGYDYDTRIQQTLGGLGLGKQSWEMPLSHLSGGQKTRALLARLLLQKPDILFLDEPTNHLDMEAVEWLEHTLREWGGAVLIVSHDRFFLDNTVSTIWEMTRTGIETYSGNYSAYLMQREERWDFYEKVFTEEKARLLKEFDFIQRNWVRDSTHARALGLLKRLTRDLAIIDRYGVMALRSGKKWSEMDIGALRPLDVVEAIRKINSLELPSGRPLHIRPNLRTDQVSGNIVLRARDASVGYPGHLLFTVKELELRRGECAALIGPNGSGKTTFIKTMLGQVDPLQGTVTLGAGLKLGYFAQVHDDLNPAHTVLEELQTHKEQGEEKARGYLARYLFRGEDVYKPISALSGGERARLSLAILALEEVNFLVLDEPTNHLDVPAQEALQEVLEDFTGTILLVSHDRYLIDRLATHIWDLKDNRLHIFHGSYREFVLRRTGSSAATARPMLLPARPLMRGNEKDSRKKVQSLTLVEERIQQQEATLKRLYREIQKASEVGAFEKAHALSWDLAQTQSTLENLMAEWEKLAA